MDLITNWINGQKLSAQAGKTYTKLSPALGKKLAEVSSSDQTDVNQAIHSARTAFPKWSALSPVERGEILFKITDALEKNRTRMAEIVAQETGKSLKDALGETDAAIAQGRFMAGEGTRLHERTLPGKSSNKTVMVLREPVGVAGLIVAFNTPIANVAWKVFPALVCGNTAVLKSSEDTPQTALYFAELTKEAGLPDGVLNVIQGGADAGKALVSSPEISLISFTGSTQVGKAIQKAASDRMVKVFLELGGKNPLVVCDDCDLDLAVHWATLSAFSNAGQRCASASRIIVFESIYEKFKTAFVEKTKKLKLGTKDSDDLGPVINLKQMENILSAIQTATQNLGTVLTGGKRSTDAELKSGYFIEPTIIENLSPDAALSQTEVFGPLTCLYSVKNLSQAIELANHSTYGLTAAIHTTNINRALEFSRKTQAGTVNINAGTHGSEPHFPFGGVKDSGNGLREPGHQALDVYSNLKNVSLNLNPHGLEK